MKKPSRISILLWLLFFSTAALAASVASQVLNDSTVPGTTVKDALNYLLNNQPGNTGGLVREAPCVAGDSCGNNPPIYTATQSDCGKIISTAAFRNTSGGFSTNGNVIKLPVLTAQQVCDIWIVQSNLATQFICIDPNGQKYSSFNNGYTDMLKGQANQSICFPPQSSAIIRIMWDQLSWLFIGGTPSMMATQGFGQLLAHGQVYLTSVVDAVTGTTYIALCPFNGNGLIADTNALNTIPSNCVWLRSSGVGTSTTYYIEANTTKGAGITSVTQGAANGAGGFYPRITGTGTFVHLETGDTACVWSVQMASTTVVDGCWIVNKISSTVFDEVMQVQTGAGNSQSFPNIQAAVGTNTITLNNIGGFAAGNAVIDMQNAIPQGTVITAVTPISGTTGSITLSQNLAANVVVTDLIITGVVGSYTAADSMVFPCSWYTGVGASCGSVTFMGLSINSPLQRCTSPVSGIEIDCTGSNTNFSNNTVVGIVRLVAGAFTDTATNRYVSSFFNPQRKAFGPCNFTTSRTTASLTFVELNSEIRCNFVNFGPGNSDLVSGGMPSRVVDWRVTGGGKNNTANDGCKFAVGFDGVVTLEPQQEYFINGDETTPGTKPIAFAGSNTSLSENNHYITVAAEALTGGTCSMDSNTGVSGSVMQ